MHSKDILLEALKCFGGTVIFVSHDRGFIEDLSTRVLELTPGKFRIFPGDYKYYMQRLEDEKNGVVGAFNAGTTAENAKEKQQGTEPAQNAKPVSATKLSWEEQKKAEAERRKAEKAVAAIEAEIEKTEAAKSEAENKMSNPEVYSNGEKAKAVQKEISELSDKLEELNLQWMEAAEKLESLQ